MSRFYVPKEAVKGNKIAVGGEEAHHILDVMRLKVLDKVVAFDGTGVEYVGFIKDIGRKSLTIEVVETRTPAGKGNSKITLIQAIPKKDKMDYVVEKATELGVDFIFPVVTRRTIVKWDDSKKAACVDRWRRIAKNAAKQCGRADIPEIDNVADACDIFKDSTEYDLALIAALDDTARPLKNILSDFKGGKIAVAIGPEGDFTPDEIKEAVGAGFRLVNLGPRVLRSDTAGLAVLAILNYELSN